MRRPPTREGSGAASRGGASGGTRIAAGGERGRDRRWEGEEGGVTQLEG